MPNVIPVSWVISTIRDSTDIQFVGRETYVSRVVFRGQGDDLLYIYALRINFIFRVFSLMNWYFFFCFFLFFCSVDIECNTVCFFHIFFSPFSLSFFLMQYCTLRDYIVYLALRSELLYFGIFSCILSFLYSFAANRIRSSCVPRLTIVNLICYAISYLDSLISSHPIAFYFFQFFSFHAYLFSDRSKKKSSSSSLSPRY